MSKGKSKMGRPRRDLDTMEFTGWDILDAEIKWASEEYVAEKLGISVDTLARRIKERFGLTFAEYKKKKEESIKSNLRKKQYDVAMSGNVTMLIWLGKQLLGQSEKVEEKIEQEVKQEVTYVAEWGGVSEPAGRNESDS